jgi:hypothetical protein
LISLYRQDANSTAATAVVRGKALFMLTPLIEAEFINALELCVFRKQLTRAESRAVSDKFHQHVRDGVFQVEPLPQRSGRRP